MQAQLEAARQELSELRQRAAAREQELQAEARLAAVKWEAEARSLKDRLEAALGQLGVAAAVQAEREAGREAAAGAARREAEAAGAEARRLQEEMRRCGVGSPAGLGRLCVLSVMGHCSVGGPWADGAGESALREAR